MSSITSNGSTIPDANTQRWATSAPCSSRRRPERLNNLSRETGQGQLAPRENLFELVGLPGADGGFQVVDRVGAAQDVKYAVAQVGIGAHRIEPAIVRRFVEARLQLGEER